jgi:formylglycine-generating enzyme required for sulfatase activity
MKRRPRRTKRRRWYALHGGAWNSYPRNLRSASRGRNVPTERFNYFGFRCAAKEQE